MKKCTEIGLVIILFPYTIATNVTVLEGLTINYLLTSIQNLKDITYVIYVLNISSYASYTCMFLCPKELESIFINNNNSINISEHSAKFVTAFNFSLPIL